MAFLEAAPGTKARMAQDALDAAFAATDRAARDLAGPSIGVFGNGAPETLIAAAGAIPLHVNFGRGEGKGPMDAVIEPFVDAEVRIFLNRFASGAFDAMSGIIFVRDDAAALTAYQYATEWVRQGRVPQSVPALFLFNLVHKTTPAAARFNQIQCDKLLGFLASRGLLAPTPEGLATTVEHATRRHSMLTALDRAVPGPVASRWRNAGRFVPLARHAALLENALANAAPAASGRPRLGLVGSPIAAPAFFDMLDRFGDLHCDVQGFGQVWPGAWEVHHDRGAMLEALADDPFCLRISPPGRHRQALIDAIARQDCALVVCQLAQTDDTFGWEVPGLVAALSEQGIGLVNLGFRDPEPDEAWLSLAADKIAAALEQPA